MSTLADSAVSAQYEDGHIVIRMRSGIEIRFPVEGNERLARGAPEQLNQIEISPFGLHWPALDEDLSFKGLLAGDYGQQAAARWNESAARRICAVSLDKDDNGRHCRWRRCGVYGSEDRGVAQGGPGIARPNGECEDGSDIRIGQGTQKLHNPAVVGISVHPQTPRIRAYAAAVCIRQ